MLPMSQVSVIKRVIRLYRIWIQVNPFFLLLLILENRRIVLALVWSLFTVNQNSTCNFNQKALHSDN